MSQNYLELRNSITKGVQEHLLEIDALPPTTEVFRLALEITDVVFTELNRSGVTKETLELDMKSSPPATARAGV